MPTIQVSKKVFGILSGMRKETPESDRRYEPYNAVIERLLPVKDGGANE